MPPVYHSVSAILWDGSERLSGMLSLTEGGVAFAVEAFPGAGFRVYIPYRDIRKTELVLIFDLALNGLVIEDAEGRRFCFAMDDPAVFRRHLNKEKL